MSKVEFTLEHAMKARSPAALPPGKKLGIHCTGGWVGPRSGPEGWGNYHLYRYSIPGRSSP